MCNYEVDFGDYRKVMSPKEICALYMSIIDKSEYPDFDCWMWDVKRMGLVREV